MTEIQNKQEFIDATDSMGGSAFPFVAPAQTDKATGAILSVDIFPGMTLRDWFAGQALVGLTTRGGFPEKYLLVRSAYKYADLMIAAQKAGA